VVAFSTTESERSSFVTRISCTRSDIEHAVSELSISLSTAQVFLLGLGRLARNVE